MKAPHLDPVQLRTAVTANRHFVGGLAVLLVILVAFPGSPVRALVADVVGVVPTPTPAVASPPAPASGSLPPLRTAEPSLPVGPGEPPAGGAGPAPGGSVELPPAPPDEPPPMCDTDAVADALDQLRAPLSEAIGLPVPGSSVRKLAAIASGCSEDDPTVAVLDLALELAAFVPPTGLAPIDLPDLPGVEVPLPPGTAELLAPLAPAIRDGCANLATIALVMVVLPPALSLPFSQSDLIQFLGPATSLCALFDGPTQ